MKKFYLLALALFALSSLAFAQALTPLEQLGKELFFDTNLSEPPGQACAVCHTPEVGFTGPVSAINAAGAVYPGALAGRFGNRKPPASSYGGNSPIMYYDATEGLFIGGMFWDGRATGWTLGDPLAEQALGPFLNPLEQNNPDAATVCQKVSVSAYAGLYEQVYGEPIQFATPAQVALSYERIGRAIAAYERSKEANPFSSKFDYVMAHKATFTTQEQQGMEVFNGPGMCNACHISEPGPNGEPPVFTDFTYDNLGVPKNLQNPFYTMPPEFNPDGANWIDAGLGGFLATTPNYAGYAAENYGKHKVPTLRNVNKRPSPDFVKAYGHNGYFKSLEEIVHFYNTRDVPGAGWNGLPWPAPEVAENVNTEELGNLGLTAEQEAAIVAFMKTLDDGYVFPYVLLANDDIEINSPAMLEGNIHSNEDVEFARGSNRTYPVNISAVNEVEIAQKNTIDGDVSAPYIDNEGTITGSVNLLPIDAVFLPDLPDITPNNDDRNISGTVTLAPGAYGEITVRKNATLNLSAGNYHLQHLEIEKNATVNLDATNGEVNLYIADEIEFKGSGEFNAFDGPNPTNKVTIWSGYTKSMKVRNNGVFNGCNLIAPFATVVFQKNSFFKGSVSAEAIELQKDATVVGHFSTALPKIIPDEESDEETLIGIPDDYLLEQNYPNPFNPSTTIRFALPEAASVSLTIYNIRGQLVKTLVNGSLEAGYHQVQWDGSSELGEKVSSGLYFYRLESGDFQQVKKMLLVK